MMKKLLLIGLLLSCISLVACSASKEPDVAQIEADLIGQVLTRGGITFWDFQALSEFEDFSVNNKQVEGDTIEYDVTMRLKDPRWIELCIADTLITYRKIDSQWTLISIDLIKFFEEEM
jgi:hypothetical protein